PNGKSFSFSYDPTYGLLSKVKYPTGGYIRYVWGMNARAEYATAAPPQPSPLCAMYYAVPVITDRYVSFDGSTEAQHQHFAYSTSWSPNSIPPPVSKQTVVTTTDLSTGTGFQTIYTYVPRGSPPPP